MTTHSFPPDGPVLAPVNFSPGGTSALFWAASFAALAQRPLVVLHVIHDPGAAPGSYASSDPEVGMRPLEEVARERMDEYLAGCRAERPDLVALTDARAELAVGLPPNRILEIAQRLQASLVVMGSRGRTGLSHLLLGSKAERVVRLSPVPVTIVKSGVPAEAPEST